MLHSTKADHFHASLEDVKPRVVVVEGRAEVGAKEVLGPFLKLVDASLLAEKARTVTVDIRKLTFMSSSCFKDFVVWLSDLTNRPPEQRYRIQFLSSAKVRWQRGSLSSLSCFALDLVDIVEA